MGSADQKKRKNQKQDLQLWVVYNSVNLLSQSAFSKTIKSFFWAVLMTWLQHVTHSVWVYFASSKCCSCRHTGSHPTKKHFLHSESFANTPLSIPVLLPGWARLSRNTREKCRCWGKSLGEEESRAVLGSWPGPTWHSHPCHPPAVTPCPGMWPLLTQSRKPPCWLHQELHCHLEAKKYVVL